MVFENRGRGSISGSHDLEDVLNIVDGREDLVDELRAAPAELRLMVAATLASH